MPPFHIIIPARYGSNRLPGKPLLDIGGKPMIRRVVECANRSAAQSVTVATDDERIAQAVAAFGGAVVMTSAAHPSGTDRIAEAAQRLELEDHEMVVNVQGDEPDMPPALIDQVAALLAQREADDERTVMATAWAPLDHPAQAGDPSVVKVVTDRNGCALYFSRAAIPWGSATGPDETAVESPAVSQFAGTTRRHLGIYAYRCGYLKRFSRRPVCELEKRERLEQLRALWHGEKIACAEAVAIPAPGIDTRADLARVRREMEGSRSG